MGERLKLYGVTETTLYNLMNFDGKGFVQLVSRTVPTSQDYSIIFNCYFDVSKNQSTVGPGNGIIVGGGANMGISWYDTSLLYYYNDVNYRYEAPVPASKKKHVIKLQWTNATSSLKLFINDIEQTQVSSSLTPVGGTGIWFGGWTTLSDTNITNIALWDINLNNEHLYKGYPDGSTNSAWVDTIGDWDGSVLGYDTNTITTRDLTISGGSSAATANKLYLYGGELSGLADFDGSNTAFVSIKSIDAYNISSINGTMKYNFNLYLDNSTGYSNGIFAFDASEGLYDVTQVLLIDSSLFVSCTVALFYASYSIAGLDKQILNIEFERTPSSYAPTYLKINNIEKTPTQHAFSASSGNVINAIGRAQVYELNAISIARLNNATIWDLTITEVSTGIIKHGWKGYPAGNTLGAWVDNYGDLDAVAINIANTRTISGIGNMFGQNFNKLLLG